LNERYENDMHTRFDDPNSSESRDAMDQIREFVTASRTHDVQMAIVLFPDPPEPLAIREHDYSFAFLHERVLGFCTQEGLTCLDLREAMTADGREQSLRVNHFDGHPNSEANRIAAEEIFKRFGPIWDRGSADRTQGAKGD